MCLIFEHQKPALNSIRTIRRQRLSVFVCRIMHIHINGTGIVFLRHFQIIQFPMIAEILCSDHCHIHKRYRSVMPAGIHIGTHISIIFKRTSEQFCIRSALDSEIFEFCKKRCMPAMIRPVRIQYTDFRFRRIPFLFFEIVLHEFNICKIHCKPHFTPALFKLLFIPADKPLDDGNISRLPGFHFKRFGDTSVCQTGIDGIYQIIFYMFYVLNSNRTCKYNHPGTLYQRFPGSGSTRPCHSFTEEGKTLGSRICPLVVLSRQIFPHNNSFTRIHRDIGKCTNVTLRFGKNTDSRSLNNIGRNVFYIIPIQITHTGNFMDPQEIPDF